MSDSTTIDRYIDYAQRKNLFNIGYNKPIKIGRFEMYCNSHSTGNSIEVSIITENGNYGIINGTYWFSSGYCFNEFKWESGAWDKALEEAFTELKTKVEAHKLEVEKLEKEESQIKEQQNLAKKQEVESLFK